MKYVLKISFSVLLARRPVGVVLLSKNNKSDQKTEKPVSFENKNMKNEANLNSSKCIASTCGSGAYNALSPKTQNGTKPNEANLKPISNTTKPSLFLGETSFSRNLLLRNEPNLSSQKLTVTYCVTVVYNALQTKPKKGTNPNEPNLGHLFRGENLFKNPPLTITDGKCPLDTEPNFGNLNFMRDFDNRRFNYLSVDIAERNFN